MTDEGAATIVAHEIQQLESAQAIAAKAIVVRVPDTSIEERLLSTLSGLLGESQGHTPVFFDVVTEQEVVRLRTNQFLRVQITPNLLDAITAICPKWEVVLE